MLYCARCQVLCESECPSCGSKKLREVQQNDPVLLATANELECDRITALLQDNDIPYEERVSGLEAAPSVVFGRYASTNKNIFVPFDKLSICKGMLGCEDSADEDSTEESDCPMQPAEVTEDSNTVGAQGRFSRMFWRATSVVLFILLILAVVTGTDFVTGWIKNLF